MRVTNNLKNSIKTAIQKKAEIKEKTLKKDAIDASMNFTCKLDNFIDALTEDFASVCFKQLETFISNNPDYYIEGSSYTKMYSIQELQTYLKNEVKNRINNALKNFINSRKVDKSKQKVADFKIQVQNTVEDIVLDLELGSNKQQVNDLINNITF